MKKFILLVIISQTIAMHEVAINMPHEELRQTTLQRIHCTVKKCGLLLKTAVFLPRNLFKKPLCLQNYMNHNKPQPVCEISKS